MADEGCSQHTISAQAVLDRWDHVAMCSCCGGPAIVKVIRVAEDGGKYMEPTTCSHCEGESDA